jgi:hypothetical protein
MRSVLAALACIALAGCSDQGGAKGFIAEQLKDPGSAQFRNVVDRGELVCGEVNAKNSFGGYGGYKPFLAEKTNRGWDGGIVDTSPPSKCQGLSAGEMLANPECIVSETVREVWQKKCATGE